MRAFAPLVPFLLLAAALEAQDRAAPRPGTPEFIKMGHSAHGEAFDVGPRQKPWVIEGIGKTHFPITTAKPDVQMWFDQGNTLLHSFWFYEAERAFRWCLKLEPDNAMAYWGLARSASDRDRSAAFMREAAKRKHKASERERLYIEAWEELYKPEESGDKRRENFRRLLEKIILKYPDDVEAKTLFAAENIGSPSRVGNDLLLKQALAREPNHPGAHHYRIHTWDSREGDVALDSCAIYGRLAPQIGHAQHMPGHIYSGVGMWHEAAISMDAATRVEKQYMRRRLTFPFNNWNYAHNRNYLAYIQEQLGMADAAISGARQLIAAPLDPKYNDPARYGAQRAGLMAMMRALIKFERWRDVLDPKMLPWGTTVQHKVSKAYSEAIAHIGLGDLDKAAKSYAAHVDLKKEVQKPENKWLDEIYTIQALELKALLALARGDVLNGLGTLADAAHRELDLRDREDDPPELPNVLYTTLGRAYLMQKSPALAVAAFHKTLEVVRNDGFALSGLVEAHAALGENEKAREALARLLYVWSDADPGLKWLEQAQALGIKAGPKDSSPRPQRNYRAAALDHLGPNAWEPYEAPKLEALDHKGQRVSLDEYRGRNVLLVFYLGEECAHCLEQLIEVNKKKADFLKLNTEVLAISSDTPEENAASLKMGELSFRLLSDAKFENARRFQSYDDFEELELHSTILIDKQGRVRWSRNGGEPFRDFDFLFKEIRRLNEAL